MAEYTNDLRLKEIGTGESSGTWGTETNTNLELIAEAFSFGTEAITTNADTHTTTIADGSTDPGRSIYLKYTGTLDSACTITIGPNTVSKLWFIENGTSGSQNIIISQGSGANVTIPAGHVKAVYSDGAGSGAAMVDAFTNLNLGGTTTVDDLTITDDLTVTDDLIVNGDIDLEGNMDINGSLETDALSLNGTTVSSTAAELNLLDGSSANTVVNSKAVIYGSSGELAGTLSTAAQTNITSLGTLTTLTVDDITINGSTISDAGNLTLDVGGDIILDAGGDDITFKSGGTEFGGIFKNNNDMFINSAISDGDIKFRGNDGGSFIIPLTLDMSNAGRATFNENVIVGGNLEVSGADVTITSNIIHAGDTNTFFGFNDADTFRIVTGGTEALRVDSSQNLFVGKTSSGLNTVGVEFASSGRSRFTRDGGNVAEFNRKSDHGSLVSFNVDATSIGTISSSSSDFVISSSVSDKDILFKGNDGGSAITALTLDMSDAGTATFNHDIKLGDNSEAVFGAGSDLKIYHDGSNSFIQENGTGDLRLSANNLLLRGDDTFIQSEDGSVNSARFNSTTGVTLFRAGSTKLETTSSGVAVTGTITVSDNITNAGAAGSSTVFNEDGTTADFRVESDSNTHMLFVDGGLNRVAIGSASPATDLHISSATPTITFTDTDNNYDATIAGLSGSLVLTADANAEFGTETIQFHTGGSQRATIDSSGNVGIGATPAFSSGSGLEIERSGTATLRLQDSGNKSAEIRMGSDLEFVSINSGSNMVFDATGDIILDADGGDFTFKDGGTTQFQLQNSSGDLQLVNNTQDKDIKLMGDDGGSTITALTLDMSQAGEADFTGALKVGGSIVAHQTNRGVFEYASNIFKIRSYGANAGNGLITFQTGGGGGSADSEAMRINSDGDILFGVTSLSTTGAYFESASNSRMVLSLGTSTTSSSTLAAFKNSNGTVGSIAVSGSATAYNTSSDARLKDVTGSARGLEVINELNPVAYNWKADNKADEGLIAQEVGELVPNAVNQNQDGYYQMDYSKLVTHLVKAIQEQQEQIESLTSEIANLKEK